MDHDEVQPLSVVPGIEVVPDLMEPGAPWAGAVRHEIFQYVVPSRWSKIARQVPRWRLRPLKLRRSRRRHIKTPNRLHSPVGKSHQAIRQS